MLIGRPSGLALVVMVVVTSGVVSVDSQGTDTRGPFAGPVTQLPSPAPPGSSGPHLTTDARGRVFLSWLETREPGGHRLRVARLDGSAWTEAATIAEGTNFLANWADVPAVFVAPDGTMAAHWLERGAERSSYGIRLSTSADSGRTWTAPVIPHRDSASGEHGFVSFFAHGSSFGLVWLDGRELAVRPGLADQAQRSMTLRATTFAGGKQAAEVVVDPRVCECCPTSAARTSDGAIVAYRDRSDDEVRDIAVARFSGGAWSAPAIVHRDQWQINGCPVNGPAVAAIDSTVAVAWFTIAGGTPHTYVAFSSDGGREFGAPVRVDVDATLGRLAIAMPDPSRVIVTSLERSAAGPQIAARAIGRDGRASAPVVVTSTSADRQSGFARAVVSGRRLIVAWTEFRAASPTSVRVASGALQSIDRSIDR
jgi:hypothetical protein